MTFELYKMASLTSAGAVSEGFDFSTLGTLLGWWQIHNNDQLTFNGSDVSQVTDLSAAGNHLVQATAANQAPVGNLINGVQAFNWDGSNYKYNASGLLTPAAGTIATVVRTGANVTATQWIHGTDAASVSDLGFVMFITTDDLFVRLRNGTTFAQATRNNLVAASTNYVFLGAWDGDEVIARINNSESSPTSHSLGSLGTEDFWFGTLNNRTDFIFTGAIGTTVFYSELLDATGRANLVAQLATIYGISL